MDEYEYKITVTANQLHLITSALENMSRGNSGQVEHFFNDVWWLSDRLDGDTVKSLERNVKSILFPELHLSASYGVGRGENKLQKLTMEQYEIYRQLQHLDYMYRKEASSEEFGYSVLGYPPLKYTDKPLPKLEKIIKDK